VKDRNLDHKDDWKTPDYFYNPLNEIYHFDFDPCPFMHDISEWNGLEVEWGQVNFCNPPYSQKLKEAFVDKGLKESKKGKTVVFLLPVSTSTKLFHNVIKPNAKSIEFIFKRLRFSGYNSKGEWVENKTGMHDSMLVVF